MRNGRKRVRLEELFDRVLNEGLGQRVLPINNSAAQCAADLAAKRHKAGRNIDFRDTLIAGAAIAHHAKIATRNTRHFDDLGVTIINPWKD